MAEKEWRQRLQAAEAHGETLIHLSAVDDWIRQHRNEWEAAGYEVELFPITQGLSKNSVRFNLDGTDVVSTIIVWDSGEWDVSVGHATAEQPETSDYQPAQSTEEVLSKVEAALHRMGVLH